VERAKDKGFSHGRISEGYVIAVTHTRKRVYLLGEVGDNANNARISWNRKSQGRGSKKKGVNSKKNAESRSTACGALKKRWTETGGE